MRLGLLKSVDETGIQPKENTVEREKLESNSKFGNFIDPAGYGPLIDPAGFIGMIEPNGFSG